MYSPATSATINGVLALIIAASDESIHCCATANSTNGIAIQVIPTSATCGQSSRGTGARAAGSSDSASAPNAILPNATSVGAKCSRPISTSRNDPPQVTATPTSMPQSRAAKASVCWAAGALTTRTTVRAPDL
jgi:hypothetical protein